MNTIFHYLETEFPDSSKRTLHNWIKQKRVLIDGIPAKRADDLLPAEKKVTIAKKQLPVHHNLTILYEDSDLVVVNKAEGLLSVATNFDLENTAHAILKRRKKSGVVYPVHRLDRETSGVMVFAYSEKAREGLKKLFYDHNIKREYVGVVEGLLSEPTGSWQSYLLEDDLYVVKSVAPKEEARLAITHFEALYSFKNKHVVKFILETGRKNQIRVHASEAGHPLVGDVKYGAKTNSFKRLALHAQLLEFEHPVSKKRLSFTSPPSFIPPLKVRQEL